MKRQHKINRALVPKESQQSIYLNIVIMCPEVPCPGPGGGCPTLRRDRTTSKPVSPDVDVSFSLNIEDILSAIEFIIIKLYLDIILKFKRTLQKKIQFSIYTQISKEIKQVVQSKKHGQRKLLIWIKFEDGFM